MKRRDTRTRAELAEQHSKDGGAKCGRCQQIVPIDQFPKGKKLRDGQQRYNYCKPCHAVKAREWSLFRNFRLSPQDYDKILAFQLGVCCICNHPPKSRRLAVDHDHRTGLIRGLLCMFCNRAIGLFRDDIDRFERVVTYMRTPPATAALGGERYGLRGRVNNKAATKRRMNQDLFERPKTASKETNEPTT